MRHTNKIHCAALILILLLHFRGEVRYVRLGDLDLRSSTDDAQPQNYTVINRIAHPNYQPPSQYHDIAILVLDRPILKTKYVKPICLYDSRDLPEYRPVATGWGRTQFGGESSDHLMKVTLQYFSIDECRNTYSTISTRKLSSGIVDDLQICAGGRNEEKDTCQVNYNYCLYIYYYNLYKCLFSKLAIFRILRIQQSFNV